MNVITIERKILEKNDEIARVNRELFQQRGVFVINIVSAPGSGKTSILERCLERLKPQLEISVVEGDVQTDFDAQRVARFDVPVVQVVTKGGCHLEARLVQDAIARMDLSNVRLLVIENVGNLVCPANYDLGESLKVVVLSTTEGADKPLKYPTMFRNARVLLVNKTDLLPYVDCDLDELRENALQINPALEIFPLSAKTGEGIPAWCDWLLEKSTARP
ncbi:MAG: hydrogenase nickel incorporation protein HypB [Planctomycetota bacterium]|nr:hydrogenase nickel incorporation protein HypB [Planctomycetota bacterium]